MNKNYVVVIALLIGIIGGMFNYDLARPVFSNSKNAYYYGVKGKNQVSLTFNVDWGQEYIPNILDVLEQNRAVATFFITGNWAKKYPNLVREIDNRGHEIGNHGYSHKHPQHLSKQGLINLIKKNEKLIEKITETKTYLFSPPYGEVDQRISAIAHSIGYKTIMWSADTVDWQRPAAQIIVQRAVNKVGDGGIILMHPTRPTLKALPEILNNLRQQGYNFVTVSKLIQPGN